MKAEDQTDETLYKFSDRLNEAIKKCIITDQFENTITLEKGLKSSLTLLKNLNLTKNKALIIGNGGNATIASHLHNDLMKAVGIRAINLTDVPLLTAYCNDDSYEEAFKNQIHLHADPKDLLIVINSSGNSKNLVKAVAKAQEKKCNVLTFTGFSKQNTLRKTGDLNFYIPENSYGLVEMAHSIITHYLSDQMAIFTKKNMQELKTLKEHSLGTST